MEPKAASRIFAYAYLPRCPLPTWMGRTLQKHPASPKLFGCCFVAGSLGGFPRTWTSIAQALCSSLRPRKPLDHPLGHANVPYSILASPGEQSIKFRPLRRARVCDCLDSREKELHRIAANRSPVEGEVGYLVGPQAEEQSVLALWEQEFLGLPTGLFPQGNTTRLLTSRIARPTHQRKRGQR